MAEFYPYVFVFILGLVLGLFFFGLLWLTTRKMIDVKRPWIVMLSSLIVRMGVVLTGFYFIARIGNWSYILTTVAGFIVARIVLIRALGPKARGVTELKEGKNGN